MEIGIFYFSATGVTKVISNHIAEVLEKEGHSVRLVNIILREMRFVEYDFKQFDACIFGFTVFARRPPSVAEDWMSILKGNNQKCAMFFTYGARNLEWAHQVTYYLLSQADFNVVLSAEFIGRHSFNVAEGWSLAEKRPNENDLEIASRFALESIKRFQNKAEFTIDISDFTYKPIEHSKWTGQWANLYPSRNNMECSMCYLCEKECPVEAFNADSGETDRQKCILCVHCVSICPDKVIRTGEVSELFQKFLKRFQLTENIVKSKTSKIIF